MVVISFLLFFGILFSPSPVSAQAHPGYEKFKLSEKDEAQILFARERYKESIEKFKGVLKSEVGGQHYLPNDVESLESDRRFE